MASAGSAVTGVVQGLEGMRTRLEDCYRDLHAHPELSHEEHRTAASVAQWLTVAGYETHAGVGGTGVVGLLRNGDGPTVLLRADMDALPVKEQTGLPYASTVTARDLDGNEVPVMHACGHDVHVTCLLGAAALLSDARTAWHGRVVALFQPAEELGDGARTMVEDHLAAVVSAEPAWVPTRPVRSGITCWASATCGVGTSSASPPSTIPRAPSPVSSAGWNRATSVPFQCCLPSASSCAAPARHATCTSWPQACITGTSLPSPSVAVASLA